MSFNNQQFGSLHGGPIGNQTFGSDNDDVPVGTGLFVLVTAGMVLRNDEVELRKRAKITPGEVIVFQNM